jgi:hypothetical protein
MKRIVALFACTLIVLACGTAEARRNGRHNGGTYYQPAQRVVAYRPVQAPPAATRVLPAAQASPAATASPAAKVQAATVAHSAASPAPAKAATVSYSTATAQGVANIMASCGRVGHWGGNPGYEGCGMGATPTAAYNSCCYANSGMATVDVGYAQGSNGWWYCCRRYR